MEPFAACMRRVWSETGVSKPEQRGAKAHENIAGLHASSVRLDIEATNLYDFPSSVAAVLSTA
eukprot:6159848-Amphidinium_carterae.1